MKIQFYSNYNTLYITPALSIMHEPEFYLSIDIMWLRWGLAIVLKDK